MFESGIFQHKDEGTTEERLWRAVIAKTIDEWVRGPLRYSRKAEHFLFHDDRDFNCVCSSAGMDPSSLRKRLHTVRGRIVQQLKGANRMTGSFKRDKTSKSLSRVCSDVV